jgi:hypothetical protein
MLQMVNQLKKSGNKVMINSQEFAIDGSRVSIDSRIKILIHTFTQEIMRKVTFSVSQEDRQLVSYFLAMRVLMAEQLTDDDLLAYAVTGSKFVSQEASHPPS